jgi:hypothetical protein
MTRKEKRELIISELKTHCGYTKEYLEKQTDQKIIYLYICSPLKNIDKLLRDNKRYGKGFEKSSMAKVDTIELSSGYTLQDIIDQLKKKGVTDFSKVKIEMNSESPCSCECGGSGYYYGPSIYSDIRLEWKI